MSTLATRSPAELATNLHVPEVVAERLLDEWTTPGVTVRLDDGRYRLTRAGRALGSMLADGRHESHVELERRDVQALADELDPGEVTSCVVCRAPLSEAKRRQHAKFCGTACSREAYRRTRAERRQQVRAAKETKLDEGTTKPKLFARAARGDAAAARAASEPGVVVEAERVHVDEAGEGEGAARKRRRSPGASAPVFGYRSSEPAPSTTQTHRVPVFPDRSPTGTIPPGANLPPQPERGAPCPPPSR